MPDLSSNVYTSSSAPVRTHILLPLRQGESKRRLLNSTGNTKTFLLSYLCGPRGGWVFSQFCLVPTNALHWACKVAQLPAKSSFVFCLLYGDVYIASHCLCMLKRIWIFCTATWIFDKKCTPFCLQGVAYKNRRCAMCRRDIPVEFLDHPQLVYSIQETSATEDGYQWFYEGRNGEFSNHSPLYRSNLKYGVVQVGGGSMIAGRPTRLNLHINRVPLKWSLHCADHFTASISSSWSSIAENIRQKSAKSNVTYWPFFDQKEWQDY